MQLPIPAAQSCVSFMAASVNNFAATFATVPITSSSTASSSSLNPHQTNFSLSLSHKSISTSWNPHKTVPRSQRSSLFNLYGPPGPPPQPSISTVHPRPLTKPSQPLSISIGDKLPNVTLSYVNGNDAVKFVTLASLCRGKRVVLVGVSAPFSPGCDRFVKRVKSARDTSSDLIACVAVSDVFVMRAWGKNLAVGKRVMMLSDDRGEFGRALGVSLNTANEKTLRFLPNPWPRRFRLVAFNGVIKSVDFDQKEIVRFCQIHGPLRACGPSPKGKNL